MIEALVQLVEQRFRDGEPASRTWADPYPDRTPDEAAYSRVSNPERFDVLLRRVEAWLDVLAAQRIAVVTTSPLEADTKTVAGWHVTPATVGGLALVIRATSVPTMITIGVANDLGAVDLDVVPDCSCDA